MYFHRMRKFNNYCLFNRPCYLEKKKNVKSSIKHNIRLHRIIVHREIIFYFIFLN